MTIPFEYWPISREFLEKCRDILLCGESAVILVPHVGAKLYIHTKVTELMAERTDCPVVTFRIRSERRPRDLDRIQCIVSGNGVSRQEICDPLELTRQLNEETGRTVVLIGSGIDRFPSEILRDLLQRVRVMVEAQQTAVLLTGALHFRELVCEPESKFNWANLFVAQHFDWETFREVTASVLAEMFPHNLRERTGERLYEWSGGNLRAALMMAHMMGEVTRRTDKPLAEVLEAELDFLLSNTGIASEGVKGFKQRPFDEIKASPESWEDLCDLRDGKRVECGSNEPGPLEFAAAAIRRAGALEFASPLMDSLIRKHFSPARLGDLYAGSGNWVKAFAHYGRRETGASPRPVDAEDRLAARGSVQALSSSLFEAARDGVSAVHNRFEEGARNVLGFAEVWFLERNGHWSAVPGRPGPPEEILARLSPMLPNAATEGLWELGGDVGRFAVAAILATEVHERPRAAILSSLGRRAVINSSRRDLTKALLKSLVGAHGLAFSAESSAKRLKLRDKHLEILDRIQEQSGGPVTDVRKALRLTGEELIKLGYRRVMFSLVDPQRREIKGELQVPDDLPDLAGITRYPVDEESRASAQRVDIQQWVVWNAQGRIAYDLNDPLINPECLSHPDGRPIAVVPTLNGAGVAVGTIHIEREDKAVPTQQEVDDLELFGRQLARILAQHEHVALLQQSLDDGKEPLMITDPEGRPTYANKTAALALGIDAGWIDIQKAGHILAEEKEICDAVRAALTNEAGQATRQIRMFGKQKNYRGEVFVDKLEDWRGKTIGAFIDIHDLRWLMNVLDAIMKTSPAADIETVLDAMLEALKSFGYTCVRLYVIDPESGRLKGKQARGLKLLADEEAFNRGTVVLPPRDDGSVHSWRVLKERKPLIYQWGPPGTPERTKITPHGLEVNVLSAPHMPEEAEKGEGDFWIELPLFVGDAEYGKFAIDTSQEIAPEAFETMTLLMEKAAEILLAARQRMHAVREGFESSMAAVAHNLGSRLAALPGALARYRFEEETVPELKPINDDFSFLVDQTQQTIRRIRDLIGKVRAQPSPTNLGALARRSLDALVKERYRLNCAIEDPIVADSFLLESALVELTQNSRYFATDPKRLWIDVTISAQGGMVTLDYRDNGPGVPDAYKGRIFEEFFSRHPGSNLGTGLGLAFVRRALSAHNGDVRECGEDGHGVRFLLTFPHKSWKETP